MSDRACAYIWSQALEYLDWVQVVFDIISLYKVLVLGMSFFIKKEDTSCGHHHVPGFLATNDTTAARLAD